MSRNFIVGKTEKSGEIQDVRVYVNADGLNRIDIARDPRNLESRIYVVDRRSLPDGPWRRLLEVESFAQTEPERLSEVRANVEFEVIPNIWGIETLKTWGLPEGMESPWYEPLEMVGNELLLPENAGFVSGDAPINTIKGNTFGNGKYRVSMHPGYVRVFQGNNELMTLETDTSSMRWNEGIAGAVTFRGGSVYLEPAKPPLFFGRFYLNENARYMQEGLYQYGDCFLITSQEIKSGEYIGAMSVISDPFPERWINRVLCRAYVDLISPVHSPPLAEEEPERISIRVEYPETDFKDIAPKVTTPYSNETGIFNSWEIPKNPVVLSYKERPWDVLLPFKDLQDWGGYPVDSLQGHKPAEDFLGGEQAVFPALEGYTLPDIPRLPEGTIYLRWKDSVYFWVIRNEWIEVFYREGWVYHWNKASPDSSGVGKIEVSTGWNNLKIYWDESRLIINDVPAYTEERSWGDVLDNEGIWGNVVGLPESRWKPDPDYPIDVRQYEEIPPEWITGVPEGEAEPPAYDFSEAPRLWGRVLYVHWDGSEWTPDTRLSDVADIHLRDLNG